MRNRKRNVKPKKFLSAIGVAAVILTLSFLTTARASAAPGMMTWNFDAVPVGTLPSGWKVEATHQRGPLSTWQVIQDKSAPSGDHVLALTDAKKNSGSTFNLCWTDKVSFLNGDITVHFKAVRGNEDEGGGIMWRVQDKDNYYVVRYNPLEDNFRYYIIFHGIRRMLATARIALPAGTWHTMRVRQRGDRFEGFIDGKRLLTGKDRHIQRPGGVGIWTKADAVTSFDDFTVVPQRQ